MKFSKKIGSLAVLGAMTFSVNAYGTTCGDLDVAGFPTDVVAAFDATSSLGFQGAGPVTGMWATLMDTTGTVCSVVSVNIDGLVADDGLDNDNNTETGNLAWLGSRVISAQKANTANAFSLNTLSIPTGAITVATYEGGSLYGLQFSNPVDASIAYTGSSDAFGTGGGDPLVGSKVGGVNVFGGGIALYDGTQKVGSVGVSGDTSCRDAAMAWSLRNEMDYNNPPNVDDLELVPAGTPLTGLFQQPACGVNDPDDAANYGVFVGEATETFPPQGKSPVNFD